MKHICFIFCLLFTVSFIAVKDTFAFDKKTSQNKETINKVLSFIENKKYSEALPLLRNLEKKNNAWSLNVLGLFYQKGYGVKQNYNKAYKYYYKAKELNYIGAFFNLANMYQNGLGV